MKFWASTAFTDPRQCVALAKLCDEAGVDGVMMSDHQIFPKVLQRPYPYSPYPDGRPIWEPETPWPDVWVTIGAMAGSTTNIHFGTSVYIAPARSLVTVAKAVGTAAVISDNRVHLGMGAGWMKEEFDLNGIAYDTRGKRSDEMIPALREMWKGGWVEYHGEHFDLGPLTMEPHPTKPIPIWNGGHTNPALRRAARLCDGWVGNAYSEEDAEHYIGILKKYLVEYGRQDDPFEIIIGLYVAPTPDVLRKWEDKGVTGLLCVPWMSMDGNDFDKNVAEIQGGTDFERKRVAIERFAHDVIAPSR